MCVACKKIAAFGSFYGCTHSHAGAAEGCDLSGSPRHQLKRYTALIRETIGRPHQKVADLQLPRCAAISG
jgi:hypothetical protein